MLTHTFILFYFWLFSLVVFSSEFAPYLCSGFSGLHDGRSELSEKLEEAAVNEENLELKLKRLAVELIWRCGCKGKNTFGRTIDTQFLLRSIDHCGVTMLSQDCLSVELLLRLQAQMQEQSVQALEEKLHEAEWLGIARHSEDPQRTPKCKTWEVSDLRTQLVQNVPDLFSWVTLSNRQNSYDKRRPWQRHCVWRMMTWPQSCEISMTS